MDEEKRMFDIYCDKGIKERDDSYEELVQVSNLIEWLQESRKEMIECKKKNLEK